MIYIKNKREIQLMKDAGKLLSDVLSFIQIKALPGITTRELDNLTEKMILKSGGVPAFKGVKIPGVSEFPCSLCTSVNEEVVHGIPSNRVLKEGDILSVDCGVLLNGYHSDAARTIPIGKVSEIAKKLMNDTEKSFFKGVNQAVAGNRIGHISEAIDDFISERGYSIVRDLHGHGIGKHLWEEPSIPNFKTKKRGVRISSGMTLAIEPMINLGKYDVITLADGWTVVTKDGSLSAHYENTILVTDNGPEILTL